MHAQTDTARSMLHEVLLTALCLGVALVILIPAARDIHANVGWLPLWLVGMPAAAWLVAALVTQPDGIVDPARRVTTGPVRRRLPGQQARRRVQRAPRDGSQRAA